MSYLGFIMSAVAVILIDHGNARTLAGVTLRLGGIYGPGRTRLLESVRAGRAAYDPRGPRYTNRIHRVDAASAPRPEILVEPGRLRPGKEQPGRHLGRVGQQREPGSGQRLPVGASPVREGDRGGGNTIRTVSAVSMGWDRMRWSR